jgi:hypothetical protein
VNEDIALDILKHIVDNFNPCYQPEFMTGIDYFLNGNIHPKIKTIKIEKHKLTIVVQEFNPSHASLFYFEPKTYTFFYRLDHPRYKEFLELHDLAFTKQEEVKKRSLERELAKETELLTAAFKNLKEGK